ncbi:class I SAM-dependent methyltransferase [Balneolaceae bacterium YR4-1]|uniref:Class I SAM-dependent methyltransferase n=1 Tax=Halalkalibaculum roseum TaxID=2709311 RepID=A0A6M1SVT7_9BACT|nr:class I SAM-dependent methyltransferase [Halalkalibaculum roseum]NGP77100.1 class I SAM-dependent methyltransferase [Halalkalibaculum roseum]
MSLIDEYRNQYQWRSGERVYNFLPEMKGQTVLDMGCGVGDQARDFAKQGARVIGVDMNQELLDIARRNCPKNTRFIKSDFRNPLELNEQVDGLWSSFAVAYIADFQTVLKKWKGYIKQGGWIALTEIDNFFGHEPLNENSKELLEKYVEDAYTKGRYDFNIGRKLEDYLRNCGFQIDKTFTLNDEEFSFSGSASQDVIAAWRKRSDRMSLLQKTCGSDYEEVRHEFLSALKENEHYSKCKVISCIGTALT